MQSINNTSVLKVCIYLILGTAFIPLDVYALSALDEWNAASRDALSLNVKVWLGLMMLNNILTLIFVWKYVAARWVFGGFFVSHVLVMAMWAQELPVLAGQVSLFHIIFWTPGFVAIIKYRKKIEYPKPYAIWATAACIFYLGSMFFDIRHAATYLAHIL